jgi:hypothetical protein
MTSSINKKGYSYPFFYFDLELNAFMKITNLIKTGCIVSFILLSTSVLADNSITSDKQLTEVACRYEMKVTPHSKTKASSNKSWFFWRNLNMIQTLDADGDYGELWEKTANGSIQYRKLYPADKTAVEYMPADMPTNNMSFDWAKLSNMLSKQELEELKPIKKTHVLGHNAELRKGKINDQTIEVLWLPDVNLPASIIKKDKAGKMELRLVKITPLSVADKKPITDEEIANYRQIDATDFGDMENDPFVKKLMSLEGHHHH